MGSGNNEAAFVQHKTFGRQSWGFMAKRGPFLNQKLISGKICDAVWLVSDFTGLFVISFAESKTSLKAVARHWTFDRGLPGKIRIIIDRVRLALVWRVFVNRRQVASFQVRNWPWSQFVFWKEFLPPKGEKWEGIFFKDVNQSGFVCCIICMCRHWLTRESLQTDRRVDKVNKDKVRYLQLEYGKKKFLRLKQFQFGARWPWPHLSATSKLQQCSGPKLHKFKLNWSCHCSGWGKRYFNVCTPLRLHYVPISVSTWQKASRLFVSFWFWFECLLSVYSLLSYQLWGSNMLKQSAFEPKQNLWCATPLCYTLPTHHSVISEFQNNKQINALAVVADSGSCFTSPKENCIRNISSPFLCNCLTGQWRINVHPMFVLRILLFSCDAHTSDQWSAGFRLYAWLQRNEKCQSLFNFWCLEQIEKTWFLLFWLVIWIFGPHGCCRRTALWSQVCVFVVTAKCLCLCRCNSLKRILPRGLRVDKTYVQFAAERTDKVDICARPAMYGMTACVRCSVCCKRPRVEKSRFRIQDRPVTD